jgi:3-hydroxybutyrate dehydrogenase
MDKRAIVTGGASGIGRAVATALVRDGAKVIIADLDWDQGAAVAAELGAAFVQADLFEQKACRQLVQQTVELYDGVDILINNAGFQYVAPLPEFPEDKWARLIGVMLTAPFLLSKYSWPHMQAQGWGRIVNMASIHALVASPNKAGYISAKHGLIGLTRTAALEGGPHGITVNAICPSYVRTPLVENQIGAQARTLGIAEEEVVEKVMLKSTAVKKLIEPDEIAELVLYLCSDKAAAVTGACWSIDCGWTAQ